MRLFDNLYRSINGVTAWTAEFFNAIFRSIDERLHKLEERDLTVDGIIGSIVSEAQTTVQEVIDPAVLTLQQMQERGFLVANSSSEVTIEEGGGYTWIIDDGPNRDLFTPSEFTVLTRADNVDDYAVLRSVNYDRPTGAYAAEVVSLWGSAGPHSDWIIGALAGSTIAQVTMLAEGKAARDVAVGAAGSAAEDAAQTALDRIATGEDRIQTGLDREAAEQAAAAAATFDPANYYDKTTVDDALATKANSANVYSRSTIDAALAGLRRRAYWLAVSN